jgi:hypothetical protein
VINIGTPAVEAIKELRGNPHFEEMIGALGVIAQKTMLAALMTTDTQSRSDATAHARGVYELWGAMAMAHAGLHPSQLKLPALPVPEPTKGRVNA